MRSTLLTVLFLFTALLLNAQQGRKLILLHTNDFHSHLQGFAPESAYTPLVADNDPTRGGFSRIAGIIAATRGENPGATLVVDAGDCLMGTLFHALEPATGFQIPLMKRAGYDVMAMGNHDFDFGPAAYAQILRRASQTGEIPFVLCGNGVTDPADPRDDLFEEAIRDGLIRPWVIQEVNGIKVGLFSLLGADADDSAPYAVPVRFENIVKAARKLVSKLKQQGADIIVCLSHSGVTRDKKGNWAGEDVVLAAKVGGIDLIVSGHTHTRLDEPVVVNGVPIVQTGSAGRFVGRADITFTGNGITLDHYRLIPVDDEITVVAAIQEKIERQKLVIDSAVLTPLGLAYDMPVAISPFVMECDEYGDQAGSNLGALMADAIHYYVNEYGPGTDIAMVAAGVIRDPLLPGTQSVADLFRVMSLGAGKDAVPGYPLSQLWVTGRELKNIAEILIMSSATNPNHFCYYSPLHIEYDPRGGFLNKIRKIELTESNGTVTRINTSKKADRLYSIVANSYMLDFVGIIKKKSMGLVNVIPKGADGRPVTDMRQAIIDFDPDQPGLQEGKEWLALVRYLQQFRPLSEEGVPVIPEYYRSPTPSVIAVESRK